MKEFFEVMDIEAVLELAARFRTTDVEAVALQEAPGRVLADDFKAPADIPGFDRATMDGYAVQATATFGAGEGSPAYLTIVGSVGMGQRPDFTVGPGQAARIATGGMLPPGADSVVMVEHAEVLDATTIEVYKSVAPGQHVVTRDEDAAQDHLLLGAGCLLRAQEIGLLAACGVSRINAYKQPRVGILSTGDEVVPVENEPLPGQVRDVNTHTLSALVRRAGGIPMCYGIVPDRYEPLLAACTRAVSETDMVLVSGGSSVGTRDLTMEVLDRLARSHILVHGVSISPGKPTILAQCSQKPFWGLPGHVTSAMVVFIVLVQPFLAQLAGQRPTRSVRTRARLARNLASTQGRTDYVRVRLVNKAGEQWAEPILGASGLIRTMVQADGLLAIDLNCEGLERGAEVDVILFE
ncbi:MAG: molybdopterin molybdotransferase MoeA [Desulfatitalea sp.]|nr:molybdopterin molybdotransferase MoeA [Desulfatitalea sp.]NNK00674.1 molybdopterin molybdotransferase MoeA [Desulfatitalea sp.]